MDTHPIQASPQRWIVALGLLLVLKRTRPFPVGVTQTMVYGFPCWTEWLQLCCLPYRLIGHGMFSALSIFPLLRFFITILGISCTLVGSFFIRWILEFINHAVYTPFILTLPFRLCYVALLWSIILLWYRLQSAAGEREEMENQLVTMQETWMEDRRKAEASRKKEEEVYCGCGRLPGSDHSERWD